MSLERSETSAEVRKSAIVQKAGATITKPSISSVKSLPTSLGSKNVTNSLEFCDHETAANRVVTMKKTRSLLRSRQKEVESKRKAIIQKRRDILGRRQVEAARIETVDYNRKSFFQKVSSYEIELAELLGKQKEQHKGHWELGKLMADCKVAIATVMEQMQATALIRGAREKDLNKEETKLMELISTIRSLNSSILVVEDKISKNQSKKDSLKSQLDDVVLRIARVKNTSALRSSRAITQLQENLSTIERDIQVLDAKSKELISHHWSLVEERKSQERKHVDLLETVLSIKNIVDDAKNRHTALNKNLATMEKQRNMLQTKLTNQENSLECIKKKIEKLNSDREAVKDALQMLTQRKTSISAALKNILTEESAVNRELNSLQKSHRALGEQIANISKERDQLDNQGLSEFIVRTARVTRHDSDRKCQGTLTVSQSDLRFFPSYSTRDNLYHLNLPLTHVLAAQVNNLRNDPELTITLDPDIDTYSSHELRFTNEPERLRKICEYINSRWVDKIKVEQREVKREQPQLSLSKSQPQPPSTQPVDPEIIGESTILSISTFKKLILKCPKQVMYFPWKLQYSLEKHGCSMYNFYEMLKGCHFTMMLIKDRTKAVFGAYLCDEWHSCDTYYGKFETFVFRENDGEIEVWNSTGNDSFYQFSDENIFVGVKDRSAIWLSSNFVNGRTCSCPTFCSAPLVKNTTSTVDFQVLSLEVWAPSYDF